MPPAQRPDLSTTSSTEGTDEVRRKHASRSCQSCRRRKVKCDGNTPCSKCVLYHEECSYDGKLDGRKPASKAYVAALENRVKELEALLHTQSTLAATRPAEPPEDEQSLGLSHLKIDDDTGEYLLAGHASPLMHLSPATKAPRPAISPTFLCPDHDRLLAANESKPSLNELLPNRPLDWNRDLPEDPAMTRELHDHLINLFFAYLNQWSCFVEESLFRRDMSKCLAADDPTAPLRLAHYSPLLHNALIALAAGLSPTPVDADPYSRLAKTHIEPEAENKLLSSVQGLFILAEYHAGAARQTIGFLYFGISNYSCSNLGLAVSLKILEERGLVDRETVRQRQRTFGTWLIQDKLWSTFLGRQPSLMHSTFEVDLPGPIKEIDEEPWTDFMAGKDAPVLPCMRATCLNAASRLVGILERILTLLYPFRARLYATDVMAKVSAVHLELERFYDGLDPAISISPYAHRPVPNHVIILHATYWFVQALCHRPYYSPRKSTGPLPINHAAVQHCERAASKILNLLALHRASPGLRYAPITLTQVTFLAGSIHLLSAINSDPSIAPKRRSNALTAANECVQALEEMGQSWKCATQSAEILKRLIQEWVSDTGPGAGSTHVSLKRTRPSEGEEGRSRDLHRSMWDSMGFTTIQPAANSSELNVHPLPALPNMSAGVSGASSPRPAPSFGRYQPPNVSLPPAFSSMPSPQFQDPSSSLLFAPTPNFAGLNEDPSVNWTDNAFTQDDLRIDPFASEDFRDVLNVFGQEDMFMPFGTWHSGGHGATDDTSAELPQWLRDLGEKNRDDILL